MAEPEDMPSLSRVQRKDDPEHKMREDVIAKGRKLGEAIEARTKAEMSLASAQAAYDEACRDVSLRQHDWRIVLGVYQEYVESNP